MTGAIWKQAVFGGLPLEIIDGDRSAKYPKRSEFTAAGVPFLNSTNIEAGRFDTTDLNFISHEKAASIMKGRARPGDIVMTTRGSIGKVALFPRHFPLGIINAQMLIVRSDPGQLSQSFLFNVMRGPEFQERLRSFSSGSAQPQIPIRDLRHIPLALPPLPIQQRIAAILSAYDDLIENNTRRIAILEEMARRLYEEWFVHFRFPGHEEAEFDGELPKGWHRVELGALVDDRRDAVQPDAVDPSTPYVGLEHIPRRSITLREWSEASTVQSTKLIFREDDILFGKIRPYFHKVVLAPLGGVTSSDTIVLRAYSRDHLALAALCASSDAFVDHATQTSNGTKMPRADWKVLKSYPVAQAEETLLARFNSFVLPLFATLKALNRKNANLRAQRDMLLPKLISGEIDVTDAEELLEAAE